jgi:hypothetical protein
MKSKFIGRLPFGDLLNVFANASGHGVAPARRTTPLADFIKLRLSTNTLLVIPAVKRTLDEHQFYIRRANIPRALRETSVDAGSTRTAT